MDKIRLLSKKFKVAIFGDLNAHYNEQFPFEGSQTGTQLHTFLEGNDLVQLIAEPTRINYQRSTILDLVITNCSENFINTGILSPP